MPTQSRTSRTGTLAGLLITGILTGCGGGDNAYQAPPPPSVTAINPTLHEFQPYQDVVSTVRPKETIEIRARVTGFLKSREFTPGQMVSEGQSLFTLEPDEYQASVNGALADLEAAKAKFQLDVQVSQKYQLAFDKGAASEVELLEANAKVQVSSASVDQAEARLERANLDLSYTNITCPINGRIGEDLVSIGNLVGRAEPTLLAKVSSIDPMNVYFDVPEKSYLDFQKGMQAARDAPEDRSAYPFQVVLPDGTVYAQTGTLDFIDIQIDRTTGTMRMRGTIANPDGLLRDGLFVRSRLQQPSRTALALPASAVLVDMAGEYIYEVNAEDGVVARQGVQTGRTIDGLTEILKGIDSESVVIVDGILRARPGSPVTPEIVDLSEAMRRIDPGSAVAATD